MRETHSHLGSHFYDQGGHHHHRHHSPRSGDGDGGGEGENVFSVRRAAEGEYSLSLSAAGMGMGSEEVVEKHCISVSAAYKSKNGCLDENDKFIQPQKGDQGQGASFRPWE